jgi:hypothetical protein
MRSLNGYSCTAHGMIGRIEFTQKGANQNEQPEAEKYRVARKILLNIPN